MSPLLAVRIAHGRPGAVVLRMQRKARICARVAVLVALPLVWACGPDAGGEARVGVRGTREGSYLAAGGVDLGNNIYVFQALLRLGRVTVSTRADSLSREAPLYVDLFEEKLVLQGALSGRTITGVSLEIPAPAGDGVLLGEAVSVYASGTMDGVWFEYRDEQMQEITVEADEELDERTTLAVEIQLDLKAWFDGIDTNAMVWVIKPSGDPCFYIDAARNPDQHDQIEESIRGSLSIEAEELDVED